MDARRIYFRRGLMMRSV